MNPFAPIGISDSLNKQLFYINCFLKYKQNNNVPIELLSEGSHWFWKNTPNIEENSYPSFISSFEW